MKSNRIKMFIENFLFYGVLTMLQKCIPFITLPIITRLLKDPSSYGVADMFNLIISFGAEISGLGIYDAVFREFFEDKANKEYQKRVTATGLNIILLSGTVILFIFILNRESISKILFGNLYYKNLILLSGIGIFLSSVSTLVVEPTRMRNKRKIFFIRGMATPILGFVITFILITKGYTYEALIYTTIIVNFISVLCFIILNKNDFSLKILDTKILKELLKIGIPLVPSFLIYWIFNSMDKIMINRILNSSELGIYSIGERVASISQLVYTAFAGGWSYFAFSTMKDKDQVKLNSNVFEYLGVISFFLYLLSQPFINFVFNLFFEGLYIRGSEVFSFLFLSPLLLMLFQTVGNQVIIVKKTYLSVLSLLIGALLNIMLNYIFIVKYGIRGAAFSTVNSYIVSVFIMCIICYKNKLFIYNKRFILISVLTILGIYLDFFFKEKYYYKLIYILDFIFIIIFYFKDLKLLVKNR